MFRALFCVYTGEKFQKIWNTKYDFWLEKIIKKLLKIIPKNSKRERSAFENKTTKL